MDKEATSINYVPEDKDVHKQERKIAKEINKFALSERCVKEIDRYIDKYTPIENTNTDKVRKVVNLKILPAELRKAFPANRRKKPAIGKSV